MIYDPRGVAVTSDSCTAVAALETALLDLLAHRSALPAALAACLAADPGLVAAHVLAGFAARMQAREELEPVAAYHLAAARDGLRTRGGTAREHALVAALALWQEAGCMAAAADRLDAVIRDTPLDAMTIKLSHALRFMLGDGAGMRHSLAQALPAWTPAMPGWGFIRGMQAFALEETDEFDAAERCGRAAVAAEPADVWGWHAVAHVMETDGRAQEGLAWIDGVQERLAEIGGFGRHLIWHAALFHLHLGRPEAALVLHDRWVHDRPAEDVRDFANAASLLWRIEAQGIPAGQARWDALAGIAERRLDERGLAFIDLHHVLALGAAGRHAELADKVAAMRRRATGGADTQAEVLSRYGLVAAQAIDCILAGDHAGGVALLLPLRDQLPSIGGSGAQRDLFDRLLIDACLSAGQVAPAMALLDDRAATRATGAWEAHCGQRLDDIRHASSPAWGVAPGLAKRSSIATRARAATRVFFPAL